MSNKKNKNQRRKDKLDGRKQANKQRVAVVRDDEKRTVITQGNSKGYDVQMISDFLDHLLLELRVQQYENQKLLKSLGSTDDLATAMKVTEETSQKLVQQFAAFQKKYQTALLPSNVIDGKNATEAESKGVMTAVLRGMSAKRDEQIGHLEALQDLFKEALHCARLPFGFDKDGNPIQAHVVHSVRELADQAFVADLPTYEELLPLFSDHPLAKEEGIKFLRELDRSIVIVATNNAYDRPLVLYGAEFAAQQQKEGNSSVRAIPLPVSSFSDLQFTIAAIRKFVGIPSTDGSPWKDL
jgi:hypothetical protein